MLTIGLLATCVNEKYQNQIKSVEATWGNSISSPEKDRVFIYYLGGYLPCSLVLGEETSPKTKEQGRYLNLPGVGEDYLSAFYKHFLGLKALVSLSPSDFYLIAGTDNYIHIDRILAIIKDRNPQKHLFYGGEGGEIEFPRGEKLYFPSGGAGFLFSRKTAEFIAENTDEIINNWPILCLTNNFETYLPACDIANAYFLKQHGIYPEINPKLTRFNYLGMNEIREVVDCDVTADELVICHFMNPDDNKYYHQRQMMLKDVDGWSFISHQPVNPLPTGLNLILVVTKENYRKTWEMQKQRDQTYFYLTDTSDCCQIIQEIITLNPFYSSHLAYLKENIPDSLMTQIINANYHPIRAGYSHSSHKINPSVITGRIDYLRELVSVSSLDEGFSRISQNYALYLENYVMIPEKVLPLLTNLRIAGKYVVVMNICRQLLLLFHFPEGKGKKEEVYLAILLEYFISAWWLRKFEFCQWLVWRMEKLTVPPNEEIIRATDYLHLVMRKPRIVQNEIKGNEDLYKNHYIIAGNYSLTNKSYITANPCLRPNHLLPFT